MKNKLSISRKKNLHKRVLRIILLVFSLGLFLVGAYQLILLASPTIIFANKNIDINKVAKQDTFDAVIIPSIGVNVEFRSGGENILNDYAWHRYPERGNPEIGGNFILSAHRFKIGLTPGETKRNSPFYNVDKLKNGDPIYVRWKNKMYKYKISKKYNVKPTQVEIEAPSEQPKLTLYTCSLGGSADGRVVLEAKPDF
jgi:sortase A